MTTPQLASRRAEPGSGHQAHNPIGAKAPRTIRPIAERKYEIYGPAFQADPYAVYARMREHDPVL
jgi:hypothetical protein